MDQEPGKAGINIHHRDGLNNFIKISPVMTDATSITIAMILSPPSDCEPILHFTVVRKQGIQATISLPQERGSQRRHLPQERKVPNNTSEE